MATLGSLVAHLELQTASFNRGLDRAAAALRSQTAQMRRQNQILQRSFNDVRRSVDIVRAGFAALGAGLVVRNIVQATVAMERINNTLRAGTGSAQGAAQALQFVRDEAQRLGLDLSTAADQFGSLTAAARGTSLEGRAIREIFTAVSEAMTVLGRSSEQTGGALTAIEQIISKGRVSAEELRGQLGERLPGAFQIAARSIGVTTQELDKMLRLGELTAEQLLPALAAELRATFGPEVAQAAGSLQASLNRLNTAAFEFKAAVGEGGVADAISDFARGLSDAAQGSDNMARQLGAGLGLALRGLGTVALFAADNFRGLAAATAAFAAAKVAGLIYTLVVAMTRFAAAVRAAAAAQQLLNLVTAKGKVFITLLAALVAAGIAYEALGGEISDVTDKVSGFFEEIDRQTGGLTGLSTELTDAGEAATETANAMADMLSAARRENEQLVALRAAHAGYGSTVEDVNIAIAIDNQLRAAKITRLEAEKTGLLEVMVANQRLRAEIDGIIEAQEEQARAAEQAIAEQERQAERTSDLLLEPFRNFISSAQSSLALFFEEIFSGGVKSFSDLFEEAKRLVIRFAAEMAALLVFRPQLLFGAAGGAAAAGAGGAAPSLASALGIGGLTGGINRFGAGVGFAAPAGPGITNGVVSGFGPALAGGSAFPLTLAQTLGFGAAGLGGGALLGSFFGGRGQIGGAVGGGLGAIAGGALAGSAIFPGIGTGVGALIGGLAGGLGGGFLGSLFGGGGGQTNKISPQGGLGAVGLNASGAGGQFVRQLDQQLVGLLTTRQEQLIDAALRAAPATSVQFSKTPSANDLSNLAAGRIGPAASALGFNAAAVTGARQQFTPEQQVANLTEAMNALRAIEDLSGSVRPFEREMSDLRLTLDEAWHTAARYGISLDGVVDGQRLAIEALQRQQEVTKRQTLATLGVFDPFELETMQLRTTLDEAWHAAARLGISMDGVIAGQRRQIEQLQREQQVRRDALALSVVDPFDRLRAPLEALGTQLEFSLLNPADQAAKAAADFRRIANEAAAGSTIAIEQLAGAGQLFIEQAGRFGASPGQVAAIREVQETTRNITDQLTRAQQQAQAGIEEEVSRARRDIVDTLGEVVAEVRLVADEVKRLRR